MFLLAVLLLAVIACSKDEVIKVETSSLSKSNSTSLEQKVPAYNVSRENVLHLVDSLYGDFNTNIWVSNAPLQASDSLLCDEMFSIYSPAYVSWVVLVDKYPMANWGHECEYVFVNAETSTIESQVNIMLPSDMHRFTKEKSFLVENRNEAPLYDANHIRTLEKGTSINARSGNRWAVIINGGVNKDNNHRRYWNDCSAIYTVLTSCYGYSSSNIFVLMSDGTSSSVDLSDGTSSPLDLDGDGVADIDYSATKSNITSVFNTLGQNVRAGDDVFIYVIDHGTISNIGAAICLWGTNSYMYPSEFRSELNKINNQARVHIVMGQCYSGAFVGAVSSRVNTTIATACSADETSWISYDNPNYDEFVYQWTAAVCGEYPTGQLANADYDQDGTVSILEAFKFAEENDRWSSNFMSDDGYPCETPQYLSNSNYLGYNHNLTGKLFELPTLTGPTDVDISLFGEYVINNLPPMATIQWRYSDVLVNSSTSNTIKRLSALNQDQIYMGLEVSATVTTISKLGISFPLKITGINYWKHGISLVDDMMMGSISESGGFVSLVNNFNGAYGYRWYSDNGLIAEYQGLPYTNFVWSLRADPPECAYISVEFYSALGEEVTLVQPFIIQ